jgi:hypothetical protein
VALGDRIVLDGAASVMGETAQALVIGLDAGLVVARQAPPLLRGSAISR